MFAADYHVHSSYSCDCGVPMEKQAEAAERAGLTELCFCDHHNFCIPPEWREADSGYRTAPMLKKRDAEIAKTARRFAGKLSVLCGTELGEPWYRPKTASAFVNSHKFDFVLASNHGLDKNRDFFLYHPDDATADGLIGEYYGLWLKKLDGFWDFDCVGHFTYPLRTIVPKYGMPDLKKVRPQMEAILRSLIEHGKGIEVNTSAFRQGFDSPYPDYDILRLYRSLGGELITTGSDAHLPQDVGHRIPAIYDELAGLGFRYVASFCERKPTMMRIV